MSKLSKEDKVNMYYLWKNQYYGSKKIAKMYKVHPSNVWYLISLINKHGLSILDRSYQSYSDAFKLEVLRKVVCHQQSVDSIALEYALPSRGMVYNWLRSFRENGYNVHTKKRGQKANDRSREGTARSGKSQAQERESRLTREELEVAYHQ